MPSIVDVWGFEQGVDIRNATHDGLFYDNGATPSGGSGAASLVTSSDWTAGSHSTYALKLSAPTSTSYVYRLMRCQTTSTTLVASLYMRVSLPPSGTDHRLGILALVHPTGPSVCEIAVSETGQLYGRCSTSSGWTALTGLTISNNTTFRIDARASFGTTTYQLDVSVNGGPTASVTLAGQTARTAGYMLLEFEVDATYTSTSGTAWYDDVVLSVTSADYPLGPHKVKARRPNADGTHATPASFTDDAGTAVDAVTNPSYVELDDQPWPTSGTADHIKQITVGTTSYVEQNYADTDAEDTTIWGVQLRAARNSGSTTAHTAATQLIVGSTTVGCWGTAATSWASNVVQCEKSNVVKNPTKAQVDAMVTRFGFSNDVSPTPLLLAFMVEYAIAATAPGPLGLPAETDSALATSAKKEASVGIPSDAETAPASQAVKSGTLGQAAESDTDLATSAQKAVSLGVAADSETAPAAQAVKSVSVGQAADSETALPLPAAGKATTLSISAEADTPPQASAAKTVSLGEPQEADSALPVAAGAPPVSLGLPQETDAALPVSATHAATVGVPQETDAALSVSSTHTTTAGAPQEADTALPVSTTHTTTAGTPSETDAALPVSTTHAATVGTPQEVDTALPVSVVGAPIQLGLPQETEAALPVSVVQAAPPQAGGGAPPRRRRASAAEAHEERNLFPFTPPPRPARRRPAPPEPRVPTRAEIEALVERLAAGEEPSPAEAAALARLPEVAFDFVGPDFAEIMGAVRERARRAANEEALLLLMT